MKEERRGDGFICRILATRAWQEALETGHLPPTDLDRKDGFFHLSAQEEVPETLQVHFQTASSVIIAFLSPEDMGDLLKWEPVFQRGGKAFPHYYGEWIPLAWVKAVEKWHLATGAVVCREDCGNGHSR